MDYAALRNQPAYYAPDADDVSAFLEAIFGDHEWQEGECIALRGLQEKGVPHEGRDFMEQRWAPAGNIDAMAY